MTKETVKSLTLQQIEEWCKANGELYWFISCKGKPFAEIKQEFISIFFPGLLDFITPTP